MKFILVLLAVLTGLNHLGAAEEITGKVVSVIDGNTIQIESKERGLQKILLAGIDCPEIAQDFGGEAKLLLEKLVLKKNVLVELKGKDRSGNYLGVVMVDEDDDIRVKLLKAGLAWTAEKNPDVNLEGYRQWAQQKGKGLWKDPAPVAPWIFRRQQTMIQPKSS
jgi:endonuclease YncB( thermonuclease family)